MSSLEYTELYLNGINTISCIVCELSVFQKLQYNEHALCLYHTLPWHVSPYFSQIS